MPRGIILIVIDCLRADHVSAYGYERGTTPTIDRLAERGVLWEQCHATSSWTKPSVTSMMTGLYPTQHGALEGIKRSKGRLTTTDVLRPSTRTLAETLAGCGWRCGAFINNAQLGEFSGLNRGFEAYHSTAGKADALVASFRDWLEADVNRPAFAYLHFLEAHWPYRPRHRHVRMFGGDRETNMFRDYSARDYGRLRHAISHGDTTLDESQLSQMVQLYDGAVRRLDEQITFVLGILDELNLSDQFAVVVTADHGEEFLEHGQIGHGQSLHDELTHVPLVARIPDGPCGVRRAEPVSLVDLSSTLLGWLDLADEMPGRDLLSEACPDAYVFSELRIRRRYTQAMRSDRWKLLRRYAFAPTNGEFEAGASPMQWTKSCPHDLAYELYDLDNDPREQDDVAGRDRLRSVRDELTARLDHWSDEVSTSVSDDEVSETEIDSVVVERLRDLGYLD